MSSLIQADATPNLVDGAWPTAPLGELLDVQNGFAFKSEFFTDSGEGLPLVRIRDLGKATTEVRYKGEYREEFLIGRGDYLIGMDGDFEVHRWRGGIALLNQRVCRLRNFSRSIEPEYVYYCIQGKLRAIHANTSYVTVKHISSKQIKAIRIPVPPIEEQRRIVDILKRADGIRRLREQAQETARQLIPALFVDMFGDPMVNRQQWPIVPLNEVASIGSGVTKGRKLKDVETVELPYLRVANVQDGHLDLSSMKTITVKRTEVDKYSVLPGDFLMTEGGDPDKLGRGAIWTGDVVPCLHQNHVFRVRCDRSKLIPDYLRSLVGSAYGKAYFLRVAKQTTGIASINKTQLGNFPVLLPTLAGQEEFLTRLTGVESVIDQQKSATFIADSALQALMHQAFASSL